jgi:hypothetical protein
MPGVPGFLCSFIPLPARVASKKPAKVRERLLLISRGAKLVRRLVRRVFPFPTLTLTTPTTLTTLPALLQACRALSYTRRTPPAVLQACKALSHACNFLLALTRACKSLTTRTPALTPVRGPFPAPLPVYKPLFLPL